MKIKHPTTIIYEWLESHKCELKSNQLYFFVIDTKKEKILEIIPDKSSKELLVFEEPSESEQRLSRMLNNKYKCVKRSSDELADIIAFPFVFYNIIESCHYCHDDYYFWFNLSSNTSRDFEFYPINDSVTTMIKLSNHDSDRTDVVNKLTDILTDMNFTTTTLSKKKSDTIMFIKDSFIMGIVIEDKWDYIQSGYIIEESNGEYRFELCLSEKKECCTEETILDLLERTQESINEDLEPNERVEFANPEGVMAEYIKKRKQKLYEFSCTEITKSINEELANNHFATTILFEKGRNLTLFSMGKIAFGFLVEDDEEDFDFVQVGLLERGRNTDKYHFMVNLGVRKSEFEAKEIFDMIRDVQEQLQESPEEHNLYEFENPREVIAKYVRQIQSK